jgi:hypothetical protein
MIPVLMLKTGWRKENSTEATRKDMTKFRVQGRTYLARVPNSWADPGISKFAKQEGVLSRSVEGEWDYPFLIGHSTVGR